MAGLAAQVGDLESRSRREILIFCGAADNHAEPWSTSKNLIIDAWSEHFSITAVPSKIEQAYHLGRYLPGKRRQL